MDGLALLLGDNLSVVLNTTVPSSALKKQHNAIAYHRVWEGIAGGIICFSCVSSEENLADIMTKPLLSTKFYPLVKELLFQSPIQVKTRVENPNICESRGVMEEYELELIFSFTNSV